MPINKSELNGKFANDRRAYLEYFHREVVDRLGKISSRLKIEGEMIDFQADEIVKEFERLYNIALNEGLE